MAASFSIPKNRSWEKQQRILCESGEKRKIPLNVKVRRRHGTYKASKQAKFAWASLQERETGKLTQCHFESKRFKTFTIAMRKFFQWHFLFLLAFCKSTHSSIISLSTLLVMFSPVSVFTGISDCCLMKHQIRERERERERNNNSKSYLYKSKWPKLIENENIPIRKENPKSWK